MGARVKCNWSGPNYYHTIPGQLQAFGLTAFEGRQHSGIDGSFQSCPDILASVHMLIPRRTLQMSLVSSLRSLSETLSSSRIHAGSTRTIPRNGHGWVDLVKSSGKNGCRTTKLGCSTVKSRPNSTGEKKVGDVSDWILKENAAGQLVALKTKISNGDLAVSEAGPFGEDTLRRRYQAAKLDLMMITTPQKLPMDLWKPEGQSKLARRHLNKCLGHLLKRILLQHIIVSLI